MANEGKQLEPRYDDKETFNDGSETTDFHVGITLKKNNNKMEVVVSRQDKNAFKIYFYHRCHHRCPFVFQDQLPAQNGVVSILVFSPLLIYYNQLNIDSQIFNFIYCFSDMVVILILPFPPSPPLPPWASHKAH